MNLKNVRISTVVAGFGLLSAIGLAQGPRQVAVGPWMFTDGNVTSRTMVVDTIRGIVGRHGMELVPQDVVQGTTDSMEHGFGLRRGRPNTGELARYASKVHADILIFGKASWHTRSIWVGTGPKTISTAEVDLYVFNARQGTITYQKQGSEGRSDEKENALKDVADVLVTPIVTVVSGGPATPREQRAAQIAIGRALRPWIMRRR